MSFAQLWFMAIALFARLLHATADTVQGDWETPSQPDKGYTVSVGDTMKIKWDDQLQFWFGTYCKGCDTSNVDLWVDTWSKTPGAVPKLITSGIDVTNTFEYDWDVEANFDGADPVDSPWVFRFLPAGSDITNHDGEIDSPGFNINVPKSEVKTVVETQTQHHTAQVVTTKVVSDPAPTETTEVQSSIETDSSDSTSTVTTTSAAPDETSSNSPTKTAGAAQGSKDESSSASKTPSSGLSSGAKAGIGIGAALGALVIFALGVFFARRHLHRPTPTLPYQYPYQHQGQGVLSPPVAAEIKSPSTFAPSPSNPPHNDISGSAELGGGQQHPNMVEVPAVRDPAELPGRRW